MFKWAGRLQYDIVYTSCTIPGCIHSTVSDSPIFYSWCSTLGLQMCVSELTLVDSRFQSITLCHFLYHLRQVHLYRTSIPSSASFRHSPLQFVNSITSSMVGNLGAPLDLDRRFDESPWESYRSRTSSRHPLSDGLPIPSSPTFEDEKLLMHLPNLPDKYVVYNALNAAALLNVFESILISSPVKIDEYFEDLEYAKKILAMVRRGDTSDEVDIVDDEELEYMSLMGNVEGVLNRSPRSPRR